MKKQSFILFCLVLLAAAMTYSQDSDKKQIAGVRGGWHSASLVEDGSKPDTAKSLSTFYVGFFRDNKVMNILFFGTGIEYFQNGLKYDDDARRVLHTISVPLNLKVKIGPVFALGGAAANFKMAERIIMGDDKNKPPEGDKSKVFDVAAFAGAGVKIFFISVELRYHWGLLEVRNDMKSRYFQLGAAISF